MEQETSTKIKTLLSKISFRPALASGAMSSLSVNSLSKISNKLDGLSQGENLKRTALIVSVVFCSYFTADLVALLFEKYLPNAPTSSLASRQRGGISSSSPTEFETIINRNIFSSKAPPKGGGDIDLNADPVLTSLPFTLVGTVILHDPNKSIAAIQDKGENKLYPIRVGDEIEGKAQIISVEPTRVVFINMSTRRKEMVELPVDPTQKISYNTTSKAPSAGVQEVQENNFVVKRAEIDSQLANWNTLIQQALAVPEMQGGQMVGFRLRQVQPGSFYEKLGIKQDDLITSVNGEKLTDVAKAASLLNDLKTMNSLSLGINRKGKDTSLNYDIQ